MFSFWFKIKDGKSHPFRRDEKGSVLVIAILVLGLMVFLSAYFISFSLTGAKMAHSQKFASQTYYLAEAGVEEAIFKLKNDPTWKSAFETLPTLSDPNCSSWSISPLQRTGGIFQNGSYYITISNLGCAKAEITSQALLDIAPGRKSQRIVKIKVYRAMGNPVSSFGILTGDVSGNLEISAINSMHIYNGSLFSNNIIKVKDITTVTVDGKALASGNILVSSPAQLIATKCGANICQSGCDVATECPPASVSMPSLDFDSASPGSYYSQAASSNCSSVRQDGKINCVFTTAEFEKMLWLYYPQFSLPVNVVVYVTGDVNIRGGQDLTVNGVLAADRDINLGQDLCWSRSELPFVHCGSSRVTVVRPGNPDNDQPAGLLAKRKINGGSWLGISSSALNIHGLLYSGDEAKFTSLGGKFEIHGGLIVRKFTLSGLASAVNIYLEPDVIIDTLKNPQYSPVITIDHWEEEY